MGGILCQLVIEDTVLTRILQKALNEISQKIITQSQLVEIVNKSREKSTQTLQLQNSSVSFQYRKKESQRVGLLQSSIVVIPKLSQLRAKSIIVFENAYFIGIIREQMQGSFEFYKGNLYLLNNQRKQFEIKDGRWSKGLLSQCEFNRVIMKDNKEVSQNICRIVSKVQGRTIRIKFNPAEMIDVDQYQGQFSISLVNNLMQMISGKGKICFRNGDIYEGEIRQGKMHTSEKKTAIYIQTKKESQNTIISHWNGPFKNNTMDGQFTVTIKDNIQEIQFNVQMVNGLMDKDKIQFKNRVLRKSIFKSRLNQ